MLDFSKCIVLASTIPAHALYFGGYEISKMSLSKSNKIPEPIVHFVSGAFADICGSFIWVPMVLILILSSNLHEDVVKQRLQIQKKVDGAENVKYKGSWHAVQTIVKEEGVKGLFKVTSTTFNIECI